MERSTLGLWIISTKQNKKKEGYKLAVWFAIAIRTARLLI